MKDKDELSINQALSIVKDNLRKRKCITLQQISNTDTIEFLVKYQ